MNIFYLDKDPRQCAEWMVDKHVVKMILETAQLLSTAHRVIDGLEVEVTYKTPDKVMPLPFEDRTIIKPGQIRKKKVWVLDDHRNDILYGSTHKNHPSAVWCRQSVENYNWLVDHLFALGDEYTYRYGKKHKTIKKLGYEIQSPPHGLRDWDMTPMPSCMAEEYIVSDDPITNYRNYYKLGKANIHAWKKREAPAWIL
jgi:hypothetical protein